MNLPRILSLVRRQVPALQSPRIEASGDKRLVYVVGVMGGRHRCATAEAWVPMMTPHYGHLGVLEIERTDERIALDLSKALTERA